MSEAPNPVPVMDHEAAVLLLTMTLGVLRPKHRRAQLKTLRMLLSTPPQPQLPPNVVRLRPMHPEAQRYMARRDAARAVVERVLDLERAR